MPDQIEQMFASLADDADHAPRVAGPQLRTRTDRRAALRATAALAVVAVAVAGTAIGGRWLLTAGPDRLPNPPAESVSASPTPPATPAPAPAPTPTPTLAPAAPSSPAAPSRAPVPKSVPDRLFLSDAELDHTAERKASQPDEVVPALCGKSFPSDRAIGVRRSMLLYYGKPLPDGEPSILGGVNQSVTVYREDGAERFLAELRTAVRNCKSHDSTTNKIIAGVPVGDDSLVVQSRWEGPDAVHDDGRLRSSTTLTSVVRRGDTVLMLQVSGWEEGMSPTSAEVSRMTKAAYTRLAAWR